MHFLTLGYALVQIPGLILSMYDYWKDREFLRKTSKRGDTKAVNDRVLGVQVKKYAHERRNGNTKVSGNTHELKKQNVRMSIEQRFRLLEDKIDKLITIAKVQKYWE